jgi:sarcosine oxidase subunit beta
VKRYSIFSLVGGAVSGQRNWPRAWRNPAPKKRYDAIVIGGGGHGLATAYYLAKDHGIPKRRGARKRMARRRQYRA